MLVQKMLAPYCRCLLLPFQVEWWLRFTLGATAKACFHLFTGFILTVFPIDACNNISVSNRLPWISHTKWLFNEAHPWLTNDYLAYPQTSAKRLPWSRESTFEHLSFIFFLYCSFQKICPLLLFLLLKARRCWGKLNLANNVGKRKGFRVFLFWLSEWWCTTASCRCLSSEKSQIKISWSGRSLSRISQPEHPMFKWIKKRNSQYSHIYKRSFTQHLYFWHIDFKIIIILFCK